MRVRRDRGHKMDKKKKKNAHSSCTPIPTWRRDSTCWHVRAWYSAELVNYLNQDLVSSTNALFLTLSTECTDSKKDARLLIASLTSLMWSCCCWKPASMRTGRVSQTATISRAQSSCVARLVRSETRTSSVTPSDTLWITPFSEDRCGVVFL